MSRRIGPVGATLSATSFEFGHPLSASTRGTKFDNPEQSRRFVDMARKLPPTRARTRRPVTMKHGADSLRRSERCAEPEDPRNGFDGRTCSRAGLPGRCHSRTAAEVPIHLLSCSRAANSTTGLDLVRLMARSCLPLAPTSMAEGDASSRHVNGRDCANSDAAIVGPVQGRFGEAKAE
jgi:hypothetical protein